MSIMGSDAIPETPSDRLHNALVQFTMCVGEALEDICSYGLTIGESYVPFDPDPDSTCEENEAICSQVWVRVTGVQPSGNGDVGFGGTDCYLTLAVGLEVGVIRCINIAEDGEAPTESEVMTAALQAMDDMLKLQCAALACEVWESFDVGIWTPTGPMGGQYGGIWTFTAEL